MSGAAAVPYAAQWESPALIGAILAGDLTARDDPRWARSGAADVEQYEFWSGRVCGMACLRSVLLARYGEAPGTVTLALEVLRAGGYRLRYAAGSPAGGAAGRAPGTAAGSVAGAIPEGVDGLVYAPFVTYLAERWGIEAVVAPSLATADLIDAVAGGRWVMASVHPAIRRPERDPPGRGGHLVLVHQVAAATSGGPDLVLHNPSGDRPDNQADARVSAVDFDRFFARRGVVFSPA